MRATKAVCSSDCYHLTTMQTDTAEYERHQRNLQVFESLQSSIDDEVARRERIRDAVRDLDSLCRTLTAQWVNYIG